ncbi:MBL fold metallo-hydrolase [Agromyces seonyuensis]|uniref:MBL fold metallo-hydrolase n=1 Tax=Agromyces seonyuensis TaxID=2662446 RepID=A0A6I4NSM7_9MICO|nr:MBL fold metallo-hydrolase [Agromyces seonyuensis]MWB97180.1 MBL fold metallo-hydrolase [Agromyces seonyuensis]
MTRLTRIGGPTVLVELDGRRILVDPTFDPPGREYAFALGTRSTKLLGPALGIDELGPIDLVLVSHDHHADNLDDAGRGMLGSAGHVVTTASGAKRLTSGADALPTGRVTGLRAWESVELPGDEQRGLEPLEVTATPCRHGPPLTRPIVGDVVGFALRRPGADGFAVWVTGDTVWYGGVRDAADRLDVDVAIVNVGGVRFGITGPLHYTMTGRQAVSLVQRLEPRVAAFAHYDGWSHFLDGPDGLRTAVEAAPSELQDRVRWLPDGRSVEV